MTLAAILAAHPHVLLDFDGPICAVFGGETPAPMVARQLVDEGRRRGLPLPADLAETGDPFDVLHAAAAISPDAARSIERALRDAEIRAVTTAPTTPGICDAIDALRSTGHTITVVSNNSDAAVRHFLARHDLTDAVPRVVARTESDPALLKPAPHLVTHAVHHGPVGPDCCVLIGDSTTDVLAARAAQTAIIAYANKPGKHATFAALHPDHIIDTIDQITRATARPSIV
jgi:beta-phosphoglucomutase-like phosphatase (HAD superfamily)